MLKKDIRKIFTEKRLQLPEEDMRKMTRQIITHFQNLSLPQPNMLLSYYPITERNEFAVDLCEKIIVDRFSQTVVAWPRLQPDKVSMQAIPMTQQTVLVANEYNIPEPSNGIPVDPLLIDLVFVPLLAFDQKGYRVGYGKGYYDRFLARCRPDVVRLGFSLFEPIDAIEDINEFDVPLNLCISPTRVYEF